MQEAIQELTQEIHQINTTFDWASAVSAVCSVISLIAIVILLKERKEKHRPYLQISFELVKSSLVCLVIRNVGSTPASLKEIVFNKDFVNQLPQKAKEHSKDRKNLNISIYPNNQWVLCLDVITPTVLEYENTKLEVSYTYTAKNKNKRYKEQEIVEFKDYSGFLIYISEIDEMRNEIKKLGNTLEKVNKTLSKTLNSLPAQTNMESYAFLSDEYSKTTIVKDNTILNDTENKNGN